MGRFLLGSTVVLLFPPGALVFDASWQPGAAARMGRPMACYANSPGAASASPPSL
jgi:phosphatidylserine decarboxylase